MRILVLGGTRFIGPHVVSRLAGSGHEVTVFHRGFTRADLPGSVRHIHCPDGRLGDRRFLGNYDDEFRRASPELVLDMVPLTAGDALEVIRMFNGLARRIVAVSSQDVYRAYGILLGIEQGPFEPLPIPEEGRVRSRLYPYRSDEPEKEDAAESWKNDYEKILVEEAYLGESGIPGTVLRLPMVYGPGDYQHRAFEYVKRMRDGREVILLEQGLAGWRCTRGYVEDVAGAIALAVQDERAAGRVYNVGEQEASSLSDWVREIGFVYGWEGDIVTAPNDLLPEHLRNVMNTGQDLVVDTGRIRGELGYRETIPRTDSIERTIEWEISRTDRIGIEPFDYTGEDEAVSRIRNSDGGKA